MMSNTDSINLKEVNKLTRCKKYSEALVLVDEYISCFPLALPGYREKAHILFLLKKEELSLEVEKKLVVLGSNEPYDYYNLAGTSLYLGQNDETIQWGQRGVELCEYHDVFYYFQGCHFYKALAHVHLCEYQEALKSCAFLDEGYDTYIYGKGMVSKTDVEQRCHAEINRLSKRQKEWRFDE